MAFNGSGTYVLPGAALVDGQTVSATEHNTFRNDVATALTTCITRDGQSPATANLPMGGFKLTSLAAGTGNGESVRFEQLIASEIVNTPAGSIAATDVQTAINELDTEKAPLSGATFTGPVNEAYSTVASAATTADIWSAGNTINWTGTVTTTAFPNAPQAGAHRTLLIASYGAKFTLGANLTMDGFSSGYTYTCYAGMVVDVLALTTTTFRLYVRHYSGFWNTPTQTAAANVAASTSRYGDFHIVGNSVTGGLVLDVDPTSAGELTSLLISLGENQNSPPASAFSNTYQAYGTLCGFNEALSGTVSSGFAAGALALYFTPSTASNRELSLSFSYRMM